MAVLFTRITRNFLKYKLIRLSEVRNCIHSRNNNLVLINSRLVSTVQSEEIFHTQDELKHNSFEPSGAFIENRKVKTRSQKSERLDLVSAENPDDFGIISRTNKLFNERYEKDINDEKEEEFTKNIPFHYQKLGTTKYADMIKEHIDNNRIKEALDVLEVTMLKEHRVHPENYIYNLLISGCAKVGYTKKAFMLFNDMKKRQLKVTGGTYTSLFNACANSPWPADGLQRAVGLRQLMLDKTVEPNITNYNAMIKAFGRCGDLMTAFQIVDEMSEKKIRIRVHTFNFLLQSCITEKQVGFRHALLTWRKMLAKRERPNIYSFNLLLKCTKECGFGKVDAGFEALGQMELPVPGIQNNIKEINNRLVGDESGKKVFLFTDREKYKVCLSESVNSEIIPFLSESAAPNLLSKYPVMKDVVAIRNVNTPSNRLMLVGGINGFFKEMNNYNVVPDIKTVTQMLNVIPSTIEEEQKLLDALKYWKIKVDIDFYNTLMRKRCFRFDYDSAKEVLKLIEGEKKSFFKKKNIYPNIMTYGILALSCHTMKSADELVNGMKEKRIRLNSEIMGTLLKNAFVKNDIHYVISVLKVTESEKIIPNDTFLECLKLNRKIIKTRLHNEPLKDENSINLHQVFFKLSSLLLNDNKKEFPEKVDHPWTQFRENQPETFQRPNTKVRPKRMYKLKPKRATKYVVKM